jgi:NADPH2:quinone reductase
MINVPATMRAVWYERTGPAHDVLVDSAIETPRPTDGEVLVAAAASGVNPHDTKGRSGWTGKPMAHPRIIPHGDGAGVIADVGAGVDRARVGERVWIFRADHRPGMGAAAAYAVVDARHAVPLPADVPFAIGAGLGVPALTAYATVFAGGSVAGMDVLIPGGAGAVASYAIQFARHDDARVISTTSSSEKAEHARRVGANDVIDYRREDVAGRVMALTGGRGVDRIVEVDFGANLATDVAIIKPHGWIASYSSSRVREPVLPYYPLAYKDVTIRIVQGLILTEETRAAAVALISQMMQAGTLKHPPTNAFPFSKIADAHAALESGSVIGKVVVEGPDG